MTDYVLIKRGLFFLPDYMGRTSSIDRAGRYTESEALDFAARSLETIRVRPVTDFISGPVRFEEPALKAEEIRLIRDETGMSMTDAKRAVRKAAYLAAMTNFKDKASVEDKLDFILDWITEKEVRR